MPNIIGVIASSLAKALASVLETFNRSNGSLGTASGTTSPTGNWTTVIGSWGIVTNQANTATTPSSYPLATLTFQSASVTLGEDNIGAGAGTAFWVTDSGNWWATYVDGVQSCSTCYNGSNPNYATCYNASNPNYTTCTNSGNAINGTCYNSGPYNAYNCGCCGNQCGVGNPYSCVTGYNTGNPYTCVAGYNTANPYSCVAGYNTSNPYSCSCVQTSTVKVIKSIASVISTVATFTMTSIVLSFKTIINASTGVITVRGYSNTGYGTQIGTDQQVTATGYTATNKHGILIAPVNYASYQTANIDNFQVN